MSLRQIGSQRVHWGQAGVFLASSYFSPLGRARTCGITTGALSAAAEGNKLYLLGSSCNLPPAAALLPATKPNI